MSLQRFCHSFFFLSMFCFFVQRSHVLVIFTYSVLTAACGNVAAGGIIG
jgi:hypothetical protein